RSGAQSLVDPLVVHEDLAIASVDGLIKPPVNRGFFESEENAFTVDTDTRQPRFWLKAQLSLVGLVKLAVGWRVDAREPRKHASLCQFFNENNAVHVLLNLVAVRIDFGCDCRELFVGRP